MEILLTSTVRLPLIYYSHLQCGYHGDTTHNICQVTMDVLLTSYVRLPWRHYSHHMPGYHGNTTHIYSPVTMDILLTSYARLPWRYYSHNMPSYHRNTTHNSVLQHTFRLHQLDMSLYCHLLSPYKTQNTHIFKDLIETSWIIWLLNIVLTIWENAVSYTGVSLQ